MDVSSMIDLPVDDEMLNNPSFATILTVLIPSPATKLRGIILSVAHPVHARLAPVF
jgi:hypothetical protein